MELENKFISELTKRKQECISSFLFYFTIEMREVHANSDKDSFYAKKSWAANEIVHVSLNLLLSYMHDEKEAYSNDVYFSILKERSNSSDITSELYTAIESCLKEN